MAEQRYDAGAELLFVYGTLMRGYLNPFASRLAEEAEFVSAGSCAGRLYMVAEYPGLIASTDETEQVCGEVFRLPDGVGLLAALDDYESCGPGFAAPTLYLRQKLRVRLAQGENVEAWSYIYNRPVFERTRSPDGRFRGPKEARFRSGT